jgi:hypothetical protein
MALSKNDLLSHFILLAEATQAVGHEAILSFSTFKAFVRGGEQDTILYPRFLEVIDGKKGYTETPTHRARRFIGWLPYRAKRWSLASDKLAFKRHAVENGLLTPDYSTSADADLRDVLVKSAVSSFGAKIKGPFRRTGDVRLDTGAGEYFERFIQGKIVKIWFWNAMPVCMEVDQPPVVVGDGKSTIADLVKQRLVERGKLSEGATTSMQNVEQVLAFHGRSLSDVLAVGEQQVVEIRYGSALHKASYRQVVDLRSGTPSNVQTDLGRIGTVAWQGIPEDLRAGTAYTVDAILDAEGRVWVLEMNSNPFIHPYVYQPMASTLFAPVRADVVLQ